jgi:hypothetical protein
MTGPRPLARRRGNRPAIHTGDVQLGSASGVACESIGAVHVIDGQRLLLGCDNNVPQHRPQPTLANDNELVIIRVPGLKALR